MIRKYNGQKDCGAPSTIFFVGVSSLKKYFDDLWFV